MSVAAEKLGRPTATATRAPPPDHRLSGGSKPPLTSLWAGDPYRASQARPVGVAEASAGGQSCDCAAGSPCRWRRSAHGSQRGRTRGCAKLVIHWAASARAPPRRSSFRSCVRNSKPPRIPRGTLSRSLWLLPCRFLRRSRPHRRTEPLLVALQNRRSGKGAHEISMTIAGEPVVQIARTWQCPPSKP